MFILFDGLTLVEPVDGGFIKKIITILLKKGGNYYKSGDGVSQVEITVCSTNYTIDFCSKIQLHSNCVGIPPRGGFEPGS